MLADCEVFEYRHDGGNEIFTRCVAPGTVMSGLTSTHYQRPYWIPMLSLCSKSQCGGHCDDHRRLGIVQAGPNVVL